MATNDTQALLSGQVDDVAQVMIDQQKANLQLDLVVQVRNKVVDAYNQIMNMQV
ncbi:MAG: flagellar hook-basal body complex protein FliE [Eubacteriales bacterium]